MIKSSTTNNQTPFFQPDQDYTQATAERNCQYRLESGETIYLTEAQRNFMMREHWQEKLLKFRQNRCAIASKNGSLKRCPDKEDCSTCPYYLKGKKKPMVISLDGMYIEGELDLQDKKMDVEALIIKKEQRQLIAQLIESISDTVDKTIIQRWVYKQSTDAETAKIVGLSVRAVAKRRLKVFKQLKEALEKKF